MLHGPTCRDGGPAWGVAICGVCGRFARFAVVFFEKKSNEITNACGAVTVRFVLRGVQGRAVLLGTRDRGTENLHCR